MAIKYYHAKEMANSKISNVIFSVVLLRFTLDCKLSGAGITKGTLPITTKSEHYNETLCAGVKDTACDEIEECTPPEDGKRNHCFALWSWDESGRVNIPLKIWK